jgi:hypothetical protein
MISTILRNTFEKGIPGNRPRLEVKDVGLVHHLRTAVYQGCESCWCRRKGVYESFDASYEDIQNILIERRGDDRMADV